MVTSERAAVFLDRDGVLNRAVVRDGRPFPPQDIESVEILPGVPEAIRKLKAAGFVTVMVTNQPDVVKGTQRRDVVEAINKYVSETLGIDDVRVCWCLEGDDCDCYKPKPGMILEATAELSLNLSKSYMVGDRWRDIGAAHNAGCKAIFIEYGYEEANTFKPEWVVRNLSEAADIIVKYNDCGED